MHGAVSLQGRDTILVGFNSHCKVVLQQPQVLCLLGFAVKTGREREIFSPLLASLHQFLSWWARFGPKTGACVWLGMLAALSECTLQGRDLPG